MVRAERERPRFGYGARPLFSARQLSVSDGFGHRKFALGALEGALIVAGFIGLDAR